MSETNATTTATPNATFDKTIDKKTYKFNFRTMKDEFGNESKRPSIELDIPVPSVEGLVAILENGGKGLDLLLEVVGNFVIQQAKGQVDDNEAITQETLDTSKLTWEFIANLPKAERRGSGIPKETWEDFSADYIEVMPALTGKTVEQVTNAAKAFVNKFSALKTNKPAINILKAQLGIYMSGSPNAGNFTDVLELLTERADKFLNMTEADYVANL